jgi:hypothetical protein
LTNKVDIFNDNSCLALYQFTQNANDTSGSYNGTGTDVTYSSGTNAGAYTSFSGYFNGTTSRIAVNTPMPTPSWAFSFWFYEDPSDSNIFKTILSTEQWTSTTAPHDWGLRWDHTGSGRMGLVVRNVVDPFYFDNSATGYSSQWNHCVFQYTGTRYEFWKNGTLQPNTYTHASGSWKNWGSIMQSPWDGAAGYVKGSLDQLRFFNRVLTNSEITQLINEVNQQ